MESVDAFFWVKSPGESDGCTAELPNGETCPRHDSDCSSTASIGSRPGEPKAPEAGDFFFYQAVQLVSGSPALLNPAKVANSLQGLIEDDVTVEARPSAVDPTTAGADPNELPLAPETRVAAATVPEPAETLDELFAETKGRLVTHISPPPPYGYYARFTHPPPSHMATNLQTPSIHGQYATPATIHATPTTIHATPAIHDEPLRELPRVSFAPSRNCDLACCERLRGSSSGVAFVVAYLLGVVSVLLLAWFCRVRSGDPKAVDQAAIY